MRNVFNMLDHLLRNINCSVTQTKKLKGQWNLISSVEELEHPRNSCSGSQLTSPFYMKSFFQICTIQTSKYLSCLLFVSPDFELKLQKQNILFLF